jgi:hypothetical protein
MLRQISENERRHGIWATDVRLMEPLVCDDDMARLIGADVRDELGISTRMRRRLDKRVGAMLRSMDWQHRVLWIGGKRVSAWVRPTAPDAEIRKPGRPKGSVDSAPRTRRFAKRPEGATGWRQHRKDRGLP